MQTEGMRNNARRHTRRHRMLNGGVRNAGREPRRQPRVSKMPRARSRPGGFNLPCYASSRVCCAHRPFNILENNFAFFFTIFIIYQGDICQKVYILQSIRFFSKGKVSNLTSLGSHVSQRWLKMTSLLYGYIFFPFGI